MKTDREKLCRLMYEAICNWSNEFPYSTIVEYSADYLISKGVTIPVRCSECRHLQIINKEPIYAECEKTSHIFTLWGEDTRKHFCSYGERENEACMYVNTKTKKAHEVLREKRIEKEIQQKYIAFYLNLEQTIISQYEHGRLRIPADLFVDWAKLLELELSDF